jgi:CRP-like cAMP-binding protein/di/tricarboxylate transporter
MEASRLSGGLRPSHAELLGRVDLFAGLDRVTLARLAGYAQPYEVETGEAVCLQGEAADGLYIVAEGQFGVFVASADGDTETRVGTLTPGDYFGEMALLEGVPRSATVRADVPGEVLHLEQARFLAVVRQQPMVALAIAATLSRRLRAADRAAADGEWPVVQAEATAAALTVEASDAVEPASPPPAAQAAPAPAALAPTLGTRATAPPDRSSEERSDASDEALARFSLARRIGRVGLFGRRRRVAAPRPRRHTRTALLAVGTSAGLVVGAAAVPDPAVRFILLLVAALILGGAQVAPDYAVGIGLIAGWIVLGVASPAQALAGFASTDWLFALAVLGMAATLAHSGLLFRVGLLLVPRMPGGLLSRAAMLLLTGLALAPLLPTNMGRAALTMPLGLAVADALKLRDREPAAAVLGMAAWLGAGPLMFVFLNASPVNLLAWGLLPEASRARFDWVGWLIAALPLGALVTVGALIALFLILRPREPAAPVAGDLRVQLAVLGPPSSREVAAGIVLGLTLLGWILAPVLHLDIGTVAVLGLLAAMATGGCDRRAFQELDWGYLIFYGAALGLGRLTVALGLDQVAASTLGAAISSADLGPLAFVLGVAVASLLIRLVIPQDQAMLLLSLALIPVAPALHVDPWIVVITLVATSATWFFPTQTPSYLVACSASEGRLFSQAQARRVAIGYGVVLLIGLACSVPYWRALGLL